MLVEAIDGLAASIRKPITIKGYASRSRDGIKFMDLGQSMIRYRDVGQGRQTIIFATDPPIVIEHYDYLINKLARDYRVIVFEPPGFGFSVPSMRLDYSYSSFVNLTERFIESLNTGPCILALPCVLGYSAIGLAHKRPDLITKLVLMQVPSWEEMLKWKASRDPKAILAKPVLGQILLKLLKRKRTTNWLDAALGNPTLLDQFNTLAQQAYQHGATFNLASGFQKFLINASPLPKNLSQATLFVWGDSDQSHCNSCKKSSQLMLPGADVFHIPDAGHFPELEKTDHFLDRLTQFVASPASDTNTVRTLA